MEKKNFFRFLIAFVKVYLVKALFSALIETKEMLSNWKICSCQLKSDFQCPMYLQRELKKTKQDTPPSLQEGLPVCVEILVLSESCHVSVSVFLIYFFSNLSCKLFGSKTYRVKS